MNTTVMHDIKSLRPLPEQVRSHPQEQGRHPSTKQERSFFGLGMLVDHSSFDSDSNAIRPSDHSLERLQSEQCSIENTRKADVKVISILNSCTRDGKGASSARFIASDASSCDMSVDDGSATGGMVPQAGRKSRRKMRWRVGKKRGPRRPVPVIGPQRGDSISTFESLAAKTVKSFRTFHSSDTQKVTNKKLQEQQNATNDTTARINNVERMLEQINHRKDQTHMDEEFKEGSCTASNTTARINNAERMLEQMIERKKYTTIDNSFEASDIQPRSISAKDVDTQLPSGERNQVPRGAYSTPHAIRRKKSVSPSGTDSTAELSCESDQFDDGSDEIVLGESIIAIEPDEDLEGHRTIGIFLLDHDRQKMKNNSSSSPTTKKKQHDSGDPLECQRRDTSQLSDNIGSCSQRNENNLSPEYDLIDKTFDESITDKLNATSLDRTTTSNFDDESEDESEGPLWKLAQLHAISEGHISPPPRNLETNSSVSSINSQERTRFRMFQAERNQRAMHELGERHMRHKEYDEAIEVFEEILRGQMEVHGERDYRVGTTLHNIATIYMRAGNFIKTIQICQKAIIVRCKMLGPSHPDLAVSFSQLAIAYLEIDEHRPALRAFRAALGIRRKSLDRADPKISRLLNNIGCTLFELGQLIDAKVAFEEALTIQRSIMRDNSPRCLSDGRKENNINHVLLTIAATLCNLGSIQLSWRMHEKAMVAFEEALLIQQSVLGDNHVTVLNTKQSIEYLEKKSRSDWSTALHMGVKALAQKMERKNTGIPNVCGLPKYISLSDMIADVMSLTIDDVLCGPKLGSSLNRENSLEEVPEASEGEDDLNWV